MFFEGWIGLYTRPSEYSVAVTCVIILLLIGYRASLDGTLRSGVKSAHASSILVKEGVHERLTARSLLAFCCG